VAVALIVCVFQLESLHKTKFSDIFSIFLDRENS
jgi:hypothetical protein